MLQIARKIVLVWGVMHRPLSRSVKVGTFTALCSLWFVLASVNLTPSSHAAPQSYLEMSKGMVVGMAFDGRMVSDLDKSVAFYKMLGFTEVPGVDKSWRKDEVMDRIHGTKGAESRMAKLQINTNVGEQTPFTLYLREFRGIQRRNVMGGKPPWEPGATHVDLTVPDAAKLWSDLRTASMLWPRTWDGKLIPLPGQTKGTLAYITDPDGMDVEIVEQSGPTPAMNGRPARPADPPGFNHVGLVIIDLDKAEGFYSALMGEQLPATAPPWISGDFLDSAVGGHGNIIRLLNGTFPLAADRDARIRFEIVQYDNRGKTVAPYDITDIGVNYVGFEVTDIDALVYRFLGGGVKLVSDGIVEMKGGYRVALMRDPDVGGFVEFYQPPKK